MQQPHPLDDLFAHAGRALAGVGAALAGARDAIGHNIQQALNGGPGRGGRVVAVSLLDTRGVSAASGMRRCFGRPLRPVLTVSPPLPHPTRTQSATLATAPPTPHLKSYVASRTGPALPDLAAVAAADAADTASPPSPVPPDLLARLSSVPIYAVVNKNNDIVLVTGEVR